ncbi:uncharacterized protein LOC113547998 isoform X2 [Rhopalosiphum maidis]|uniref:uncharacterized protein LOC113547998 isoform X2 n=1 Tax=Rhopalosiphum maidis TaxID=43146 RepID=UPI000EFFCC49|nr:uncharacterized protein LOC113547998 isoform X2 [Rhopalosiphum maidis]
MQYDENNDNNNTTLLLHIYLFYYDDGGEVCFDTAAKITRQRGHRDSSVARSETKTTYYFESRTPVRCSFDDTAAPVELQGSKSGSSAFIVGINGPIKMVDNIRQLGSACRHYCNIEGIPRRILKYGHYCTGHRPIHILELQFVTVITLDLLTSYLGRIRVTIYMSNTVR